MPDSRRRWRRRLNDPRVLACPLLSRVAALSVPAGQFDAPDAWGQLIPEGSTLSFGSLGQVLMPLPVALHRQPPARRSRASIDFVGGRFANSRFEGAPVRSGPGLCKRHALPRYRSTPFHPRPAIFRDFPTRAPHSPCPVHEQGRMRPRHTLAPLTCLRHFTPLVCRWYQTSRQGFPNG